MGIHRGLVRQKNGLIQTVRHSHDVDIAELRAAFAPVGMCHDVEPAHFASGLQLPAYRDCPVKQRIVAGDTLLAGGGLDMLQECRESPDDASVMQ